MGAASQPNAGQARSPHELNDTTQNPDKKTAMRTLMIEPLTKEAFALSETLSKPTAAITS